MSNNVTIDISSDKTSTLYIGVGDSIEVTVRNKKDENINMILSKAVAKQLIKVLSITVNAMEDNL